jgi:hypothetical protein
MTITELALRLHAHDIDVCLWRCDDHGLQLTLRQSARSIARVLTWEMLWQAPWDILDVEIDRLFQQMSSDASHARTTD